MSAALWLLLLLPGPEDGVAEGDLGALAERYGLLRSTDAATGREVLRGVGVHLVVAPGLSTVLWNGAQKVLSAPVRIAGGRVVVPSEIEACFSGIVPILRSARKKPPASKPVERAARSFTVVLDAGHGGLHTGGKGRHGILEKDVNLDVALRLRRLLEKYGVSVVMTRTEDVHLDEDVDEDLQRRVRISNGADPDLFLSIHSNWHPGAHARGFEVFVPRNVESSREECLDLARDIRNEFRGGLDTEDRGIKEAGFRVLKGTKAPAILVELEFVSNPQGERELGDPDHRQKLAELLFAAIRKQIARK